MVNWWNRSMSITPTAGRQRRTGRPLRQARADEEPTLLRRKSRACRTRVLVGDQPLGRRDEVIKHVLLRSFVPA